LYVAGYSDIHALSLNEPAPVCPYMGIAGFCGKDAPTFQALAQQADKALYSAKRAGGNQVIMAADQNVAA